MSKYSESPLSQSPYFTANKTISAANSLLNNCFSISATAFITNIHSSYDRRQISRHSWNYSPTKQRREALRRTKEGNFKTNCIWKRVPLQTYLSYLLFTFAFTITLSVFWDIATKLHILHIVRGRSKIIWINSIKSIFCVGIRVFQISMTTPS